MTRKMANENDLKNVCVLVINITNCENIYNINALKYGKNRRIHLWKIFRIKKIIGKMCRNNSKMHEYCKKIIIFKNMQKLLSLWQQSQAPIKVKCLCVIIKLKQKLLNTEFILYLIFSKRFRIFENANPPMLLIALLDCFNYHLNVNAILKAGRTGQRILDPVNLL